ncbi:MAG: M48 family metalloprotease [Rickettsiales bacterium]
MYQFGNQHPTRGTPKARLLIALVLVIFTIVSYYGKSEENAFTGQKQSVAMTKNEEIALGLNAAPRVSGQYGGEDKNAEDRARVERIGQRLLAGKSLARSDYRYQFHLLADTKTINAFALPGGQIFITRALYSKLTDAQLAGVLGHEIGHVVARHGAAQLAKQQLTQGLAGAAGVATGDNSGAHMAMMVGQVVGMKYGRGDELQSDILGVRFMTEAGYNPRSLIGVMKILAASSKAGRQPEFFSTHPNPENRIGKIEEAIATQYPDGLPAGLED